jgi:hypothetical protein
MLDTNKLSFLGIKKWGKGNTKAQFFIPESPGLDVSSVSPIN